MDKISDYLIEHGPSRSSLIAEDLQNKLGISPEASRKRLSRIKKPIRAFPIHLLPKGEKFLYLEKERNTEKFWINFLRDLRHTNSIGAHTIDGLSARGGLVTENEFHVISGAPLLPLKRQVMSASILNKLVEAGFLHLDKFSGEDCVVLSQFGIVDYQGMRARFLTESIIIDGMRTWAKNIGLAGFNTISIRGEENRKPIGPFVFDLAGPSYLMPLTSQTKQPGFLVADIFGEGILDENQIKYFVRKTTTLQSTLSGIGILAFLIAPGFTGPALTYGHAHGIVLATPKELFGLKTAEALNTLLETLKNAAKYASSETSDRLTGLLSSLSTIEGAAANIHGTMFELLCAYLARRTAVSIDMGIVAKDNSTGKTADIDILAVTQQASHCTLIECKGKHAGGVVSLSDVQEWIRRLPIFEAHVRAQSSIKDSVIKFELWTSGEFDPEALAYLVQQKDLRKKSTIDWKSGSDIHALAISFKEKSIATAMNNHFLKHPLSDISYEFKFDDLGTNKMIKKNQLALK